ncbi:MAG: hypothetical protein Q9217_000409 [Psora testacea]
MALNNSLTARLDELRSRNAPRLHSENTTGQNTPSFRYSGSFMSPPQAQTPIEAPNLQRRFTTDLSKMQQMAASVGQQPSNGGSVDLPATIFKKAQLLEKKKQEYEMAAEKRKQFHTQMQLFSEQEAREKQEIEQMTRDLQRAGINPGYQSEPTTPPERRELSFTSTFSRSNRYSTSSFASPPGNTRSSRSGSQLTSPPSELAQPLHKQINSDTLPSKSVPNSRRGSNDRVTAFVPETNGSARRNAAASNRYSMPVTGLRGRTSDSVPEHPVSMGIEHLNTTSFLFDDDEKSKDSLASPDVTKYLQMTDDNFPVLIRQNEYPGTLSASSAALDLALSQSPGAESHLDSWSSTAPHRLSLQHSVQQSVSSQSKGQRNGFSSLDPPKPQEPALNSRQSNRHSMEASLAAYSQNKPQGFSTESGRPSLVNAHASYSTNDVPTLKNSNGLTNITPPKNHSQQFHNHNASLGRIPPNAVNNRHSRDLSSGGDAQREEQQANNYQALSTAIQASGPSFSPATTVSSPMDSTTSQTTQSHSPLAFPSQPFYAGYGVQLMNMGMNPMMATPLAFQNQMQMFQQQSGFLPYSNYAQQARFPDNQARMLQPRRTAHAEEQARFSNVKLETLRGEILGLCKDQHGCRYLQKKLEDRNPESMYIIFMETHPHVVELMTDPFGNYLCQKLLEFSNDEQRTVLINNAAPEMVKIALNSHGTRALQKMIEFISTPEQIQTIIKALDNRVVELIQDLNGNHVIQKCLNRLTPEDAQFIFNAAGTNCVAVGTHRHGCCVLQRCIDHASGSQKAQLISQIIDHAFHLVQDPFGNYVLQYIVDLQESCFTDPLCYTFQGQIPQLSKQKFSSNVIEKCLRGADSSVTRVLIEEMLNANELEKMLRDSYANYVVQTAMDYADPETKGRLVEAIRPILPAVRQTPHGRRIQSKIMALDGQGRFSGNGTPNDRSSGQIPLSLQMTSSPMSNSFAAPANGYSAGENNFGPSFRGAYSQYTPGHSQTISNGHNFPHFGGENIHQHVQQPASFARLPQVNGGFF